jgi:NAD(P)-dependent dehydrogenase (short-subunit alcohol dehydrogenase family)
MRTPPGTWGQGTYLRPASTCLLSPTDINTARSPIAGLNGIGGPTSGGLGYTAAKHGVVGLMRAYANILAQYSIRVNTVHPTGMNTPIVVNDAVHGSAASKFTAGLGQGPFPARDRSLASVT